MSLGFDSLREHHLLCLHATIGLYVVVISIATRYACVIDTLFDTLFVLKKRMISFATSVTKLTSSAYLVR